MNSGQVFAVTCCVLMGFGHTHTHTYTHTHTLIRTYTFTHIHKHADTHTHSPTQVSRATCPFPCASGRAVRWSFCFPASAKLRLLLLWLLPPQLIILQLPGLCKQRLLMLKGQQPLLEGLQLLPSWCVLCVCVCVCVRAYVCNWVCCKAGVYVCVVCARV